MKQHADLHPAGGGVVCSAKDQNHRAQMGALRMHPMWLRLEDKFDQHDPLANYRHFIHRRPYRAPLRGQDDLWSSPIVILQFLAQRLLPHTLPSGGFGSGWGVAIVVLVLCRIRCCTNRNTLLAPPRIHLVRSASSSCCRVRNGTGTS